MAFNNESWYNKNVRWDKMNKIFKVWIILGLMISIVGCSEKKTLTLKQERFKVELGTKISENLEDYLDTNSMSQDKLSEIASTFDIPDTAKIEKNGISYIKTGEYDGKITYKKEMLSFKVIVEDTVKPTLSGPEQIEIQQGQELTTDGLFTAEDLNDLEEINYDLSTFNKDEPGEYSIQVSIKDIAGNETSKTFTVVVKKTVEEENTENKQEDTPHNASTVEKNTTSNSTPSQPENSNNVTQSLAANLSASANTTQLLTVIGTGGSTADFALHEYRDGVWTEVIQCNARVGVNGIGPTTEWSKTTPNGVFSLGMNFGLNGNPGATYGYTQANSNHYWVDDVNSKYYNQFVDISQTPSDWSSAEHIVEFPGYYNYCVNINYNPNCTPGVGSAIFIHCDIGTYTYGCVAIPESILASVMQRLQSDALIAIYPSYDALY